MKFTIFQNSRIGSRKNNQDRMAYSYSHDALLMVVADGLGGYLHGEIAAQITVKRLTDSFQRQATPRLKDCSAFLFESLSDSHYAIHDFALKHSLLETPRTTCVACVVQDGAAYWGHAGDSRLYFFRDAALLTKTRDHSRVQQLLDTREITAEDASVHPDRNKIYNCLGGMYPPEIELSRKTGLRRGDTLLLCSDGLWGPLSDDEITLTISLSPLIEAASQLMEQAEFRGGDTGDNLTMVGMHWGDQKAVGDPDTVSTAGMPLDSVTTQFGDTGAGSSGGMAADISDEEIERAIAEIHSAIKKYPG